MTSLWRHSRLTYYDLAPNFLTQGVKLLPGEVWQVSKRNSQYFRSYLRKTTGWGALWAPSGARDNGEVTKLTWPKVTDIKNPKYTNCRHLCSYCTLRVSKSSDHWCAFGTMSNFEKRNLRSGHLMWPGGVTFGVIGSSFFGNVSNCLLNSYGKFGGATRRRFFPICEKPEGGWYPPPPAVRGLTQKTLHKMDVQPINYIYGRQATVVPHARLWINVPTNQRIT